MLVSPLPGEIAELEMEITARGQINNKTQVHKISFTPLEVSERALWAKVHIM